MKIFTVCKGTALKIMGHKAIHSYRPTNNYLVCERQYFEEFINIQEQTGGLRSLSMTTVFPSVIHYNIEPYSSFAIFLNAVCTDEEFENLMKTGFNYDTNPIFLDWRNKI